jgi:hypothetical protein
MRLRSGDEGMFPYSRYRCCYRSSLLRRDERCVAEGERALSPVHPVDRSILGSSLGWYPRTVPGREVLGPMCWRTSITCPRASSQSSKRDSTGCNRKMDSVSASGTRLSVIRTLLQIARLLYGLPLETLLCGPKRHPNMDDRSTHRFGFNGNRSIHQPNTFAHAGET